MQENLLASWSWLFHPFNVGSHYWVKNIHILFYFCLNLSWLSDKLTTSYIISQRFSKFLWLRNQTTLCYKHNLFLILLISKINNLLFYFWFYLFLTLILCFNFRQYWDWQDGIFNFFIKRGFLFYYNLLNSLFLIWQFFQLFNLLI